MASTFLQLAAVSSSTGVRPCPRLYRAVVTHFGTQLSIFHVPKLPRSEMTTKAATMSHLVLRVGRAWADEPLAVSRARCCGPPCERAGLDLVTGQPFGEQRPQRDVCPYRRVVVDLLRKPSRKAIESASVTAESLRISCLPVAKSMPRRSDLEARSALQGAGQVGDLALPLGL